MANSGGSDTQGKGLFENIKNAKILVVGDLPQASDIFVEAGYDTVSSVPKAADIPPRLLREWRLSDGPCLVVLSAALPDSDPFELCRKLCRDDKVPVIMVGSDGGNEWKGFHAGAVDYVPDTADPEILFYRCERVLAEVHFSEHADKIAAIISVAGATFNDPDDCSPSEPEEPARGSAAGKMRSALNEVTRSQP